MIINLQHLVLPPTINTFDIYQNSPTIHLFVQLTFNLAFRSSNLLRTRCFKGTMLTQQAGWNTKMVNWMSRLYAWWMSMSIASEMHFYAFRVEL